MIFCLPLQAQTQHNNGFYLHQNGVTIVCDDADVGDKAVVNDVTYTKRSREQITEENASTSCTSGITDMCQMFYSAEAFNQDISTWDVSSVTDMSSMFGFATKFNQDIGGWNVSNVTDMSGMFIFAKVFNQDIGNWEVSNVINFQKMFWLAIAFNQDIGDWNVSNATRMIEMFSDTETFNQDLSNWDVSNVTEMDFMFTGAASFNQNLSGWCVRNISEPPTGFAIESALDSKNFLVWGTCPTGTSIGEDLRIGFKLNANYPNPFNPTTAIPFTVPEATQVRINIYDVMGRYIDTILNDRVAAGTHQAVWNIQGSNISSGVYFYQIVTPSFNQVWKMTVVK